MKVPSTNYNIYEEDYFNDGGPPAAPNANDVDDYSASSPVRDDDFSEYMWMENEEEFDKEELQRLEEQELMEQCMMQHMLDVENSSQSSGTTNAQVKENSAEVARSSTLNPNAAEFVPSWNRTSTTSSSAS
jgi:hypothetical protein